MAALPFPRPLSIKVDFMKVEEQHMSSMRDLKRKLGRLLLVFILLLGEFSGYAGQGVYAQSGVYLSSSESVLRGNSVTVMITAPGASAGVDGIQLSVEYDASLYSFDRASSSMMGTAASEVSDGKELRSKTLSDTVNGSVGQIRILLFGENVSAANDLIAQLIFICKADAGIGPSHFKFAGDQNFISVNGVKIPATTELLSIEIKEEKLQEQATPYLPATSPETSPQSQIDVPFNPENQIGAESAADPNQKPGDYGIDRLNQETTSPVTTAELTTPQFTTRQSETTASESESTLRSSSGEVLKVPDKGLPVSEIPSGFQGDSEEIQGVLIPLIKGRVKDQDIRLYYLQAGKQPSFYTYDATGKVFTLFDLRKITETTEASSQSAFQTKPHASNKWYILVVLVIGLAALATALYSLSRNMAK